MDTFLIQILLVFLSMQLWFAVSLVKKRNDVADVAWGLGFVLLSLAGAILHPHLKNLVVFVLVSVWGLRLASHIGTRLLRSQSEDRRYRQMREEWKGSVVFNSWLRVFMSQGFFLVLVASSILVLNSSPASEMNAVNIIGIAVWVFGFAFEGIGDRQLKAFRQDPSNRGRIIATGLWRYSRHPNYFGEATLWWGIWLITFPAELFWLGCVGPITITILLRFVSGVPLAEAHYKGNPEYIEYARKTPAMIPDFTIHK